MFKINSLFLAFSFLLFTRVANAQTISETTKEMTKMEGFFDFYYSEKTDKILLEIDNLDTEFLYVNGLAAGVGSNDIGLDRNQMGDNRVVKFVRRGNKIMLLQPNYNYRAISNNADERNSVTDAFAQSILWGFKVEAEENGKILIDLSDFLMQDAHGVSETLKRKKQGSYSIDKSRSAFYLERTKNFPKNSEFEAMLTFTGKSASWKIRSVTPTSSSITVRQHHSFVELPDANFKPRKFDPRAGYFSLSYFDYATPIGENLEKQFIYRHRLEKKNPTEKMSEAVEPIIYYLDRGTPEPIRSALLEGASWWNQAFESAGYKNAFQVRLLPEGADPMDVRYNMINWVHRSTRGWSYGGMVADPRTGEIIKGHVLLGSLRVRQDYLIAEGLLSPYEEGKEVSPEMERLGLARLRQLSAHEVGHTLGLAHSYASSAEGRASVMDYPHPLIKITDGKLDLSEAYDQKIGAWDKVSIAYGYQDFPEGTDESTELTKIIQRSFEQGLTFLSDQDARPKGGSHPFAHLWDNGKSPEIELNHILDVRRIALANFGEKSIEMNEPYAKLEEVLVPIYFLHRYQIEGAVKLIGGLNYRYALRGDGQLITEFVSADKQEMALNALLKTISSNELLLPERILKLIPPRPIGYSRSRELVSLRTGNTFDLLASAETASAMTLDLLFHPARAQRLVEFHAREKSQPSLDEIIDRVISRTWKQKHDATISGEIERVVDSQVLTSLFSLASDANASEQVKAIAINKLYELREVLLKNTKSQTTPQKAHFHRGAARIKRFWDNPEKYETTRNLTPPDGSPIGMDWRCE
jgi:hypothetical protein